MSKSQDFDETYETASAVAFANFADALNQRDPKLCDELLRNSFTVRVFPVLQIGCKNKEIVIKLKDREKLMNDVLTEAFHGWAAGVEFFEGDLP